MYLAANPHLTICCPRDLIACHLVARYELCRAAILQQLKQRIIFSLAIVYGFKPCNYCSASLSLLTDTEASIKIRDMGVLPQLPVLLTGPQSSCTPKVANIIAELAKNGE